MPSIAVPQALRLHKPTRADFVRECVEAQRPAILTGLRTRSPLDEKNPFAWLDAEGDRLVRASRSVDAKWDYRRGVQTIVPLGELVAAIRAGSERLFGTQMPLIRHPWLLELLALPISELVDLGEVVDANFWLQRGGNKTPLHWDSPQNLHFLLHGSKEFWLYPPDSLPSMYSVRNLEGPAGTANGPNWSAVDAFEVDERRFPLFAAARRLEVTLEAGETLFLPRFWWHCVQTTTASYGINFWFQAPERAGPFPHPWYWSWYSSARK